MIACYIVGASLIAYTLYTVFITVFLCKPVSYFWHPERSGSCLPRLPLWSVDSHHLSSIPAKDQQVPQLKSRRGDRHHRRCATASGRQKSELTEAPEVHVNVRLRPWRSRLHRHDRPIYALYAVTISDDSSYENAQAALYSNVEAAASIMGSCLPTYNAFIAKYFPRFYHGSLGGGARSDNIIEIELRTDSGAPTSSSGETRRFWKSARSSSRKTGSTPEASRGLSETTTQVGTLNGIDEERQAQESQNQLALGMARYML